MSLSTYSQDWFDLARKELNISRGLESIGETRFATIYWSLDSTVRGVPAFVSIVRNPEAGIDSEVTSQIFQLFVQLTWFRFCKDTSRMMKMSSTSSEISPDSAQC